VEKCYRAREATDDNITWCMCFACWITKPTNTHSEYVTLTAFHSNNGYANLPVSDIIHTLSVLL